MEVNTKLRNKIAELAGSITSYDDLAVVSSTMSKAMQLSKNVFAIDESGNVKDSDYDAFKAKLIADNVDKYDGLMEAKAKEDVAALKPEAQKVTSKEEALLVITKINNAKSKVKIHIKIGILQQACSVAIMSFLRILLQSMIH